MNMRLGTGGVARALVGCAMLVLTMGIAGTAQADQKHLGMTGISSATVAPKGLGFAGISYSSKRSPTDDSTDGSAIVGVGFGNANDGVGLQFATHLVSLPNGFGDAGYFSLKASTRIASGAAPTYASATVSHLGTWGINANDDPTGTIALTRFAGWSLGSAEEIYPVMMTLGAGTNVSNFGHDAGMFGGFGIGLTEYMAASLAWTGDEVSLGGSFKIKGLDDMFLSLSFDDALNDRGFQRVTLSIGYQFPNLFGG